MNNLIICILFKSNTLGYTKNIIFYLYFKLATASYSVPNIWTICPTIEKDSLGTEIIRTSSHQLKLPPEEFTAPIKLDAVLREKYGKETGQ